MIRVIVAFLASVLTGVQGLFIVIGKEGICLNEGCEIVDSFPKLPPLYFNIAGFIFFLTLFWCFLKGRKGAEYWQQFAKLLLLAGLAAEAVLLFFQYSIVTAFCSYCLVIFSLILLLNILCGIRQLFTAVTIFAAVFAMLSTLELRGVPSLTMSLDAGSYSRTGEGGEGAELYLFFSETCEHCENVISSIREENRCDIRFNPVEKIESFEFPGSTRFSGYDPKVNVRFLKGLDIKEIPVLVIREEGRIVVLKGEGRIIEYTQDACLGGVETLYNQTSQATGPGLGFLPAPDQQEQGCSVDSSCKGIN